MLAILIARKEYRLEDKKTELGLFGEALSFLMERSQEVTFDRILDVSIRARKRLDTYPSLYNAYANGKELDVQAEIRLRKVGLI